LQSGGRLIVATFIFRQHTHNADFVELDDEIMSRANSNPGFIRKGKWLSPDGQTIRVDYYFKDQESLQVFRSDEVHRVAKKRYAEWYDGYEVEISEVLHSHSDGKL
jgi:antibiotic biosynthesis monooxygenase (ABM) superfamily enzyme